MPLTSSLIIATYNWPQALEMCLRSVEKQSIQPDEIIIADDGSGEETGKVIEDFRRSSSITIKHVRHEDDGFRKSMIINKAVAAGTSAYIIEIDGDILLHKHFIKDHLSAAKPGHFVGGSRVILNEFLTEKILSEKKIPSALFLNKHTSNKFNLLRFPFLSSSLSKIFSPKKIHNIRGCNLSFYKKDFIAVNGYDEAYTGWGREDTDLIIRFFKSGLQRIYFKFRGIEYHLHHTDFDRSSLERNDAFLKSVMQKKEFRCEKGIDQYL